MVTKKTEKPKTKPKKPRLRKIKEATPQAIQAPVETPQALSEEDDQDKKERYFEAIGRRKEASARVRLFTKKATDVIPEGKGLIEINSKNYTDYFKDPQLQITIEESLKRLKSLSRFKATIFVKGGGLSGQAEAIKHGLARALVLFDQNYRKKLRKAGFLTRDPREKERRKYGLKKARKATQWSKR